MSIRVRIALALLVAFVLGSAALLATVMMGYYRNVGVAAEAAVADAGKVYLLASQAGAGQGADAVLVRLKTDTGDDYAVLTGKSGSYAVAASTSDELGDYDLATIPGDLSEGVNRLALTTSGDSRALIAAIPLEGAGPTGNVLLVRHEIADLMTSMQGAPLMVVGMLLVIYLLTVTVTIVVLNALVFRRLDGMTERVEHAVTRILGGDFDVATEQADVRMDELGRFEDTLNKFIHIVGSTLKQLTSSAS